MNTFMRSALSLVFGSLLALPLFVSAQTQTFTFPTNGSVLEEGKSHTISWKNPTVAYDRYQIVVLNLYGTRVNRGVLGILDNGSNLATAALNVTFPRGFADSAANSISSTVNPETIKKGFALRIEFYKSTAAARTTRETMVAYIQSGAFSIVPSTTTVIPPQVQPAKTPVQTPTPTPTPTPVSTTPSTTPAIELGSTSVREGEYITLTIKNVPSVLNGPYLKNTKITIPASDYVVEPQGNNVYLVKMTKDLIAISNAGYKVSDIQTSFYFDLQYRDTKSVTQTITSPSFTIIPVAPVFPSISVTANNVTATCKNGVCTPATLAVQAGTKVSLSWDAPDSRVCGPISGSSYTVTNSAGRVWNLNSYPSSGIGKSGTDTLTINSIKEATGRAGTDASNYFLGIKCDHSTNVARRSSENRDGSYIQLTPATTTTIVTPITPAPEPVITPITSKIVDTTMTFTAAGVSNVTKGTDVVKYVDLGGPRIPQYVKVSWNVPNARVCGLGSISPFGMLDSRGSQLDSLGGFIRNSRSNRGEEELYLGNISSGTTNVLITLYCDFLPEGKAKVSDISQNTIGLVLQSIPDAFNHGTVGADITDPFVTLTIGGKEIRVSKNAAKTSTLEVAVPALDLRIPQAGHKLTLTWNAPLAKSCSYSYPYSTSGQINTIQGKNNDKGEMPLIQPGPAGSSLNASFSCVKNDGTGTLEIHLRVVFKKYVYGEKQTIPAERNVEIAAIKPIPVVSTPDPVVVPPAPVTQPTPGTTPTPAVAPSDTTMTLTVAGVSNTTTGTGATKTVTVPKIPHYVKVSWSAPNARTCGLSSGGVSAFDSQGIITDPNGKILTSPKGNTGEEEVYLHDVTRYSGQILLTLHCDFLPEGKAKLSDISKNTIAINFKDVDDIFDQTDVGMDIANPFISLTLQGKMTPSHNVSSTKEIRVAGDAATAPRVDFSLPARDYRVAATQHAVVMTWNAPLASSCSYSYPYSNGTIYTIQAKNNEKGRVMALLQPGQAGSFLDFTFSCVKTDGTGSVDIPVRVNFQKYLFDGSKPLSVEDSSRSFMANVFGAMNATIEAVKGWFGR